VRNWPRLAKRLIFVISQPRSGSTLLQKVLGSHSTIHTLSEPWVALQPLFGLRESGIAADYSATLARIGVQDFLGALPEGDAAYWEAVRLMLGHLYRRALEPSGKRFFLDKTPRYTMILPELRRVFSGSALHFPPEEPAGRVGIGDRHLGARRLRPLHPAVPARPGAGARPYRRSHPPAG